MKLVEHQMLFRRTTENAVTYTFKHALVQDTAYDSLLRSSRRDWHRRIAEVLEQRVDEGLADPPELIAIHYSRAGLAEQSIPWWLRAGRLAATGFANLEACDHYRAGVKDLTQAQLIEDRESLEIELQLQLGRAMMTTEGYGSEAVGDAYRHVLTLVTRTGDVNRQFSVLRGLTTNKYFRGEYGEAITYAKRALGIAQAHDDPAMIMRAEISLGQVHFITGNPQAGLELFDAALERARTEGREAARGIQDIDLMALTLGALALIMTGFADQAVARVTEAVEGAGRLSQWLSQSQAFSHLAMIHVWRGEPDQAIDAAQRSIALAEQYGFSDWRLQSMVHYGCALTAKNGDPAGAAMVGEAIGDLRRPGFVGSMPVYLSLYAGSLATLGRLDEAILVADDAISLAERTGEHTALSMARSERAGLEFRRGDPDHIAEDLLRSSLELAGSIGIRLVEIKDAANLAQLLAEDGRREEALSVLGPVYESFTEGLGTSDLVSALSLLEQLDGER